MASHLHAMINMKISVAAGAAALVAVLIAKTAQAAENSPEAGRAIFKRANCVGCHKWHGDGGGGYGGAALSLRKTELDNSRLWKP